MNEYILSRDAYGFSVITVALLRLERSKTMTDKATPKLLRLGRANRKTRAGTPFGVPESIPTLLYEGG